MTVLDPNRFGPAADVGRYSWMTHNEYVRNPIRLGCTVSIKTRFSPPALLLGDHSVSDPPDPISNSAVKPDRADGTNAQALEE
jgi:hypothetical protein